MKGHSSSPKGWGPPSFLHRSRSPGIGEASDSGSERMAIHSHNRQADTSSLKEGCSWTGSHRRIICLTKPSDKNFGNNAYRKMCAVIQIREFLPAPPWQGRRCALPLHPSSGPYRRLNTRKETSPSLHPSSKGLSRPLEPLENGWPLHRYSRERY